MTQYRRNRIPGGTFFFTLVIADRRLDLLVRHIGTLKEVLRILKDQYHGPWEHFIKEDLSPVEGSVILLNGRNIWSLDRFETKIQEGDELTFTVLVAGG